ncbi:putative WASP homolog-associated protein with actin, membranes and microtubules-like protein 1 [Galemys pyrenaicus]|uniref:Putative WASP homolog-associated protein with actin, membranes and microtubules-like protein 1 n=1 Tax=Galemys pyrenaicus TaxID=202257 RepID=A0A8J6DNT9_GALPY|nr:putative WASP homolog-associated protein with actin, membranes and microtubules-like protein 1 [Galemys pyrenaicus]
MQKQMEQDEKRFGQAAWATAAPRLEKLRQMLAQETLQLLRARELCLGQRRAALQGQVSWGGGSCAWPFSPGGESSEPESRPQLPPTEVLLTFWAPDSDRVACRAALTAARGCRRPGLPPTIPAGLGKATPVVEAADSQPRCFHDLTVSPVWGQVSRGSFASPNEAEASSPIALLYAVPSKKQKFVRTLLTFALRALTVNALIHLFSWKQGGRPPSAGEKHGCRGRPGSAVLRSPAGALRGEARDAEVRRSVAGRVAGVRREAHERRGLQSGARTARRLAQGTERVADLLLASCLLPVPRRRLDPALLSPPDHVLILQTGRADAPCSPWGRRGAGSRRSFACPVPVRNARALNTKLTSSSGPGTERPFCASEC